MKFDRYHPRRPRGSQSGRVKSRNECCQALITIEQDLLSVQSILRVRYGNILRTNTLGQFLIEAEQGGETVHVYDKNGMFQFSFNAQTDDAKSQLRIEIADIVTEDVSDKIYLLLRGLYNKPERWENEVQVLDKTADLQYKFPVRYGRRLIVSGSKLVILAKCEAHVYNQNGEFERSFEFFKSGSDKRLADCTATYDGRILIMHRKGNFSDYYCVHVFTMEGQ